MTSTLNGLFGILFLSVFFSSVSSAQIINTIGGNGTAGNSGDGGQALSASVQGNDITADAAGNVYFVTDLTIRKISPSGVITLFAGDGTSGIGGDSWPAVNAQFLAPRGIACDAAGNVYICDGNRVRKINTSGIISTVAGSTTAGFSGDGGLAWAALFNVAADIAIDGSGNIYIADKNNGRVRKIDATTSIITSIGGFNGTYLVTVTTSGVVYFVDVYNSINRTGSPYNGQIGAGVTTIPWGPDGVSAGSQLNGYATVQGLACDDAGNVFFSANNRVRVLKNPLFYTYYTYAGNGTAAFGGDGSAAYLANLNDPKGIMMRGGNLYISDKGNNRIRKVNACTGVPATPSAITGVTTFCPGTTYTFSTTAGNDAFYYSWTFPNDWYITSTKFQNTITAVAGASGSITVKAHNLCGESTAQTLVVSTVNPAPTFIPAGTVTLCTGATIQLAVNAAPGMSIQWKKDGVNIPGATSASYTANALGHYTVQQTHISGCSGTFAGVYVVAPTASIGSPQGVTSFCPHDSLMLQAQTNSTYITISGYQWQLNGVNIPNTDNNTFYATQPGSYSVIITSGCAITSPTFNVQLKDTAVISASSSTTEFCPQVCCIGMNLVTPASNPSWYHNNVQVSSNGGYIATAPGVYEGRVTNYQGCTSRTFIELTDHPLPLGVTLPDGDFSCDGSPLLIEAINCQNCVYQWYQNANFIPGASNSYYSATVTAGFAYTVSDNICGPYTAGPYFVNIDSFEFNIAADGPTSFCAGEDVELMVPGAWTNAYQWKLNGNNIPNAVTNIYVATTPGDYSVTINNANCSFTTAVVNVSVIPLPTATITQNGMDLSAPSGFVSYQWYLNGSAISGAISENYTATQDGDYYVIVTNNCGEAQSNTVNIVTVSVDDVNARNNVSIRPNPFSNRAVLTFNNPQHEVHSFSLYDMKGALIQKTDRITGNEFTIERGALPAGVYYFQFMKEGSLVGNGKLTIQ